MSRLLLALLALALAGCAALAQLAEQSDLPWDCGAAPASAADHPAHGEAGTSADTGDSN